jgi:hypothetical protein
MFALKRDDVMIGGWKKLHMRFLMSNLCCLSDIIRIIRSRRTKQAEHVARMGR